MVERGDCHFVTKVRNIQQIGGKAAIVIDNTNENINKVIMSDDGTGAGLTIPGVMIGSKDGEILKNYFINKLELQERVEVNINFPFPLKRDYVDVNLWYS